MERCSRGSYNLEGMTERENVVPGRAWEKDPEPNFNVAVFSLSQNKIWTYVPLLGQHDVPVVTGKFAIHDVLSLWVDSSGMLYGYAYE